MNHSKPLKLKQLMNLTRTNLEKRFSDTYEQENDSAYIIQCAVIVLVRNAFSTIDLSFLSKDLIRDLFLKTDVAELASIRHLCVYFRPYFETKDWKKVMARLFNSEAEYLKITEYTRIHTDHLHPMLHSKEREAAELMNIVTTYRDETGKKHRWTIKNVDPCYSVQETTDLLCILNTLTILQKDDGTRRFTELVKYIYHPTTPVYNNEDNKKAQTQGKTDQTQSADVHDTVQQMKAMNSEQPVSNPTDTKLNSHQPLAAVDDSETVNEQAIPVDEESSPPTESSPSETPQSVEEPKPKKTNLKDIITKQLRGNLPGSNNATKKKKKKSRGSRKKNQSRKKK